MKQIIIIGTVLLLSLLSACSDDKLPDIGASGEKGGKRSITFAISNKDEGNFEVTTKAKGSPVTDTYAVKMYLFEKTENETTHQEEFRLILSNAVTTPLYTLEGLNEESTYTYVFVATSIANKAALDAIDFSSVVMTPDPSITLPATPASPDVKSVLENCYISFFDDIANNVPSYGTAFDPTPETIPVNRDLDIYGCGSSILPGMNYYTPVDVVMERQFGVVEFVFQDAQAGDQLTCSFSSEYYRLYLSQLVTDKSNSNSTYTPDNSAAFPAGVFTDMSLPDYPQGDYYSASGIYFSGYGILPVFQKTKVLANGENSIRVYVPYTTAAPVGSSVDEKYKANYIRTDFEDLDHMGSGTTIKGPKGDITLKVERGGSVLKTYTLSDTPFPVYRNGKTIFSTVGKDYIEIKFSSSDVSTDGIYLPTDDIWNGDN